MPPTEGYEWVDFTEDLESINGKWDHGKIERWIHHNMVKSTYRKKQSDVLFFLHRSLDCNSLWNFSICFLQPVLFPCFVENILPFYFHILPQVCCSFPPTEQFIYLPDSFPIKTEQILRTVCIGHDSPKKQNQ